MNDAAAAIMTEISQGVLAQRHPFVFLRHGETESNLNDTIAGSLDVRLTERGHDQARTAAAALRGRGLTAIYSSGLRRARESAEHVAQALGLSVTTIPELAERNWGELEGKPRALRASGVTPPGAETPVEFRARVLQGFERIKGDGLPLIVGHSGVFRVLSAALGIPEREDRIENARPVRFRPPAGNGPWTLEGFNASCSPHGQKVLG
jgi:2,3-bisphosphoglycerate-dependent phosphoglycerate mutase